MRTRPAPRNFSSGELAPWVDGLSNALTQQGARTLENIIVKKQGQIMRRPGSFFVNEVKDSSKETIVVPVTINDDNTYVLEIGDGYIRFYKNHARVTYAGTTTVYEVTSPWSAGDISSLRHCYLPDEKEVVFVHPNYTPRHLSYSSGTSWELSYHTITPAKDLIFVDTMGRMVRSSDGGKTFSYQKLPILESGPTGEYSYAYGRNTYLVAARNNSTTFQSEDAEEWIQQNIGVNISNVVGNEFGEFVADTYQTSVLLYSNDDGLTWNQVGGLVAASREACSYNPGERVWRVAGAASTTYYSYNLATWTAQSAAGIISALANDGNNLWIAVGSTKIQQATSGAAAFVQVFSATGATFKGIAYGTPNGTPLWIAVAGYGGGGGLSGSAYYYSSDGSTWATGTINTNQHFDFIVSHGNKFFALQASGSGTNSAMNLLSTGDGVLWLSAPLRINHFSKEPSNPVEDTNLNYEYFNSSGHFPSCVDNHEGRLVLSSPTAHPSTVWGSKINNIYNFHQSAISDSAYEYAIRSKGNVDIQWIMGGMGGLVVGTRTAEGILIGSPDEGITPLTAQFRWLSTFGSANIQPVRVHDTIVFVQRGGEMIRGYKPTANAFESPDLTAYADHISKGGVTELDHQDDPQSIIYAVRADGQLLALTFDNQMRAWSRIVAASSLSGTAMIRSTAIVPTTGAEDEIWIITKRTIGGSTKRYVEYMDTLAVASFAAAHYVDSGVYATSGTTFSVIGGLTHLAGENVDAFIGAPAANSRWIQTIPVPASGTINIGPYSGTNIHVGLPYSSYIQTMRGDYGSPWGDGAGMNKKTSQIMAWVHDSSALARFGPVQSMTLGTTGEQIQYSQSGSLVTEMVKVNFPGGYDNDNYIWIAVHDPRPFTLVAMLPDSETGDR